MAPECTLLGSQLHPQKQVPQHCPSYRKFWILLTEVLITSQMLEGRSDGSQGGLGRGDSHWLLPLLRCSGSYLTAALPGHFLFN